MSDHPYIRPLQQRYRQMLRILAEGKPFEPFDVRGFGRMPDTTTELHLQIRLLQKYEKTEGKLGWTVTWGQHTSRRVGVQQWPERITVDTPDDLAFLTTNGHAYAKFDHWLNILTTWRSEVRSFIISSPEALIEYDAEWPQIMNVVDKLLLLEDRSGFLRSISVPVHTKWLKLRQYLLLGLLRSIDPDRFSADVADLETAFFLFRKPLLFPIRWLDEERCRTEANGHVLTALPVEGMRRLLWSVEEVWLVENETNLHLLPQRSGAVAVFGFGKALSLLKDIPLFQRSRLFYWGDLDEDGFRMLASFRSMYPHAISFCMDPETVAAHQAEMVDQPQRYRPGIPEGLTLAEVDAFERLRGINGRIEQERIRLDHLSLQIDRC